MISLWTIPALPLFGALLCTCIHFWNLNRENSSQAKERAGWVASFFVLSAFGSAIWFATQLQNTGALSESMGTWIETFQFKIPIGLHFDWLSGSLCLVITGVGSLIHLYSIAYMHGESGVARYFACLNLFVAAMLLLVLADSLPLLFVGWEGVGLCSYMLIGFWHEKTGPPEAGQKAFVVNRIGDLGFLIGIFYLFAKTGHLDFAGINQAAADQVLLPSAATIGGILLFIGAIGKSAQIPLYVWLPDAMAGPTPVSALIHAATMVTAGVYLLARASTLFAASAVVLPIVALVGLITALIAASMALVEKDLKKVLAYSTVSQLGFMFIGAGVGAFQAAGFHLITHAFFKALLFLAAGSVIHAMSGEQNIFKMGGLRKKLPITHFCFLIGALALAGAPPLSGFVSKDAILWASVEHNTPLHWGIWALASLCSWMTAFYSIRVYLIVFWGKENYGHETHPHESPSLMTVPLVILSVFAALGGLLDLPQALTHHAGWLSERLGPLFAPAWTLFGKWKYSTPLEHSQEFLFIGISALVALTGMGLAWLIYSRSQGAPAERAAAKFHGFYKLWSHHYWVDELYNFFIVSPLRLFSFACSLWDHFIIDGAVNLLRDGAISTAQSLKKLQTGHVQSYGVWIGLGVFLVLMLAGGLIRL